MRVDDLMNSIVAVPMTDVDLRIPYTLIACISRGRYLMLSRVKPPFVGQWNFIGGKIEPGETPVGSARRELLEEAGLRVAEKRLRFQGIAVWPSSFQPLVFTGMMLFTVRVHTGEAVSHQFNLIEEGVLAWLSERSLLQDRSSHVVPNFELLTGMFTTRMRVPSLLLHAHDPRGGWMTAHVPLPLDYHRLDQTTDGPWVGKLVDLVCGSTGVQNVTQFLNRVCATAHV
jgi:8-oxo-dGTP diphosphatase